MALLINAKLPVLSEVEAVCNVSTVYDVYGRKEMFSYENLTTNESGCSAGTKSYAVLGV
jgi:hypothetical protein